MKKFNWYYMIPILMFVFLVICLVFFVNLFSSEVNTGLQDLKHKYEQPDTTITYHNGKYDTTIIKRQAPAILK